MPLLSEFQRAVGRVSGILVLDDICKEIERRSRQCVQVARHLQQ
jgi:hypothetical protein